MSPHSVALVNAAVTVPTQTLPATIGDGTGGSDGSGGSDGGGSSDSGSCSDGGGCDHSHATASGPGSSSGSGSGGSGGGTAATGSHRPSSAGSDRDSSPNASTDGAGATTPDAHPSGGSAAAHQAPADPATNAPAAPPSVGVQKAPSTAPGTTAADIAAAADAPTSKGINHPDPTCATGGCDSAATATAAQSPMGKLLTGRSAEGSATDPRDPAPDQPPGSVVVPAAGPANTAGGQQPTLPLTTLLGPKDSPAARGAFVQNVMSSDGAAADRLRSMSPEQLNQVIAQGPPKTADAVLDLATGIQPAAAGTRAEWERQQAIKNWFGGSRDHPADFNELAATLPDSERIKLNQVFEDNKPGDLSQANGISYYGGRTSLALHEAVDWAGDHTGVKFTPGSWPDRITRSTTNLVTDIPAGASKAFEDLLLEDETNDGNPNFKPLIGETPEQADQRLHPFSQDVKAMAKGYGDELIPAITHGDFSKLKDDFYNDPAGTAARYLPFGQVGKVAAVKGVSKLDELGLGDRLATLRSGAGAATPLAESTGAAAVPKDAAAPGAPETIPVSNSPPGTPPTPESGRLGASSAGARDPTTHTDDPAMANAAAGGTQAATSGGAASGGTAANVGADVRPTGSPHAESAAQAAQAAGSNTAGTRSLTDHLDSVVPPRRGISADDLGLAPAERQSLPEALRDNPDYAYAEAGSKGMVRRLNPLDTTTMQLDPRIPQFREPLTDESAAVDLSPRQRVSDSGPPTFLEPQLHGLGDDPASPGTGGSLGYRDELNKRHPQDIESVGTYLRNSRAYTSELSADDFKSVFEIRKTFSVRPGTLMAKVLSKADVDARVSGKIGPFPTNTVGGFVARASDIDHLRTPQQLRDGLGLDDSPTMAAAAKSRIEAIARGETPEDGDGSWSPIPLNATEAYVMRWTAGRDITRTTYVPFGGPTGEDFTHVRTLLQNQPSFSNSPIKDGYRPFTGSGSTSSGIPEWIATGSEVDPHAEIWKLDRSGNMKIFAQLSGNSWKLVK